MDIRPFHCTQIQLSEQAKHARSGCAERRLGLASFLYIWYHICVDGYTRFRLYS